MGMGTEMQTEKVDEVPRQDIYSGRRLEWRWVLVGTLIMLGLQTLAGTLLGLLGLDHETFLFLILVTTGGFLGGGVLIGWLSPGWTVWEAAFSAVLAAATTAVLALGLLPMGGGFLGSVPVGLAWGVLCSLAGARLGERLQGRAER